MRIDSLALDGSRGWHALRSECLDAGLNVFCGPAGSAKSTLADLVAHALYGTRLADQPADKQTNSPEGELVVEHGGRSFRLRRYLDRSGHDRLTVASLDGSPVDRDTVRDFLSGCSPSQLAPIHAVGFREPSQLWTLLRESLASQLVDLSQEDRERLTVRRKEELVALRDALAGELESRIAQQRQKSRQLDQQWRELEASVEQAQHEVDAARQQLRAVETQLAEVDTRLRYHHLETTADQRARSVEPDGWQSRLEDLDEQIAQRRKTLADLQQRESDVRGRIAQIHPDDAEVEVGLVDQRAWLAVARQWTADLDGEVALLARASQSNTCVCSDAHPRLRPIVETIARQLNALDALLDEQENAAQATQLRSEAEHLARSQSQLQNHLEHLLGRRQTLVRSTKPSSRSEAARHALQQASATELAARRRQLERERDELYEQLAIAEPHWCELREERDAVDRQRAEFLSSGLIDAMQRELDAFGQKLSSLSAAKGASSRDGGTAAMASDYLAQLTDGELLCVEVSHHELTACVVNRAGQRLPVDALTYAQRDQVYLSYCLALATACGNRGIRLPLVLDDPFVRLDPADAAAMVAVVEQFSRRGHQVLVFTSQQAAAERFRALGATVSDLRQLHERPNERVGPANRGVRLAQVASPPERSEPQPAQSSNGTAKRRFYLEVANNVSQAPSIGPKTTQRLANVGIHTVADLLEADAVDVARRLSARHINAEAIRTWQRQARLVCQIPQLRPRDAQILVGCGIHRVEQLLRAKPEQLLKAVRAFCKSAGGERIVGAHKKPGLAEVTRWIERAGHRRALDAA